jgi:hypothetical protein
MPSLRFFAMTYTSLSEAQARLKPYGTPVSSIVSLDPGRPNAADATPTSTLAKSGPAISRKVRSETCLPLILHTDFNRPPEPPPPPPLSVRSSRNSP